MEIKVSYKGEKYEVECVRHCAICTAYDFARHSDQLIDGYYETTDSIVPVLIRFIKGEIKLHDVDDKLEFINWLLYYFGQTGMNGIDDIPLNLFEIIRDRVCMNVKIDRRFTGDIKHFSENIADVIYDEVDSASTDLYIDDEELIVTFHYDTEPNTKILKWDTSLYALYTLNPKIEKTSMGFKMDKKNIKINRNRQWGKTSLAGSLFRYMKVAIHGDV